ncbi:MAG: M1 family aminopeptidase [Bacteroidota bacterium]
MNKYKKIILVSFLLIVAQLINAQTHYEHQDIEANIDVSKSFLEIKDHITLPNSLIVNKSVEFYLNKNLKIDKIIGANIENLVNNDTLTNFYVNKYKLVFNKSKDNSFTIYYKGLVKDEIKQSAAEYARGFSETKGVISENGVYMANSTYWTPKFNDDLLSTFKLDVTINDGWSVVSQGDRKKNEVIDGKKVISYNSPEPMDEIYLIAAKWTEYSRKSGEVEVQAFLRTPDEELAQKYLGITSGYIQMYETLIGKYPYTKFALVENFWETGYGMPSFTLLGEKVIRFPWILYSSYPHELLHNYWGNGVFVDYKNGGNWCEGITAYMADHLMQEQRGNGATYRRNTLQKFTDYVNDDNDFPINQFINRNNSAEEAIGYGKVLMVNNMLRYEFGDEAFLKAYQKFYADNEFIKVSFSAIQKSFEEITGKDLSSFFAQWIDRKGAPTLKITNVKTNGNKLLFTLNQIQKEEVFNLNVPVAIFTEGNDQVIWKKMAMDKKSQNYTVELSQKPLKIEIDPQFNLMRRVDRDEVPASLSQVFGAKQSTIIIPVGSENKTAYEEMAKTWKATQEAQGKAVVIVSDADLKAIPQDQSVWILGYQNKFYNKDLQTTYSAHFDAASMEMIKNLSETGALVYAIPNAENNMQSVGFVGSNSDTAIKALSSKLLHYGKYGYLGFEGDSANNVMKGSLPALQSPLSVTVNKGVVSAKLIPRKALYESKRPSGRPKN